MNYIKVLSIDRFSHNLLNNCKLGSENVTSSFFFATEKDLLASNWKSDRLRQSISYIYLRYLENEEDAISAHIANFDKI